MYPYIHIFDLEISSYFLILSLVFTLMVYAILFRAKKLKLSPSTALDLYLYSIIGAFIGSRLFYVFYEEPSFFFKNPLEILAFWNGGFVFYGGLIGGLVASIFFLKRQEESLRKWFNFSAPLLSLGYGLGRLACIAAGCCYGKESDSMFAIYINEAFRHPTQIYASVWSLTAFLVLLLIEKIIGFNSKKMELFSVWLVLHGTGRLIMEHHRADPRGDFILGFSVSSWVSLVLILAGLIFLFKPKKT